MIKKILIVDDSPVARRIMKKAIPAIDAYDIAEAGDGREAVEKAASFSPDLIFMDLTMPEMDGFEATQLIHETNPDVIIVVATADIQPRSMEAAKESGAYRVLKKPVREADVAALLIEIATNPPSKGTPT